MFATVFQGGVAMNAGNYIAHSATPAHPDGQGLVEHLRNVASIAAGFFAGPDDRSAGIAKIAGAVGLAHDAGKYAAAVQRHLRNCRYQCHLWSKKYKGCSCEP